MGSEASLETTSNSKSNSNSTNMGVGGNGDNDDDDAYTLTERITMACKASFDNWYVGIGYRV